MKVFEYKIYDRSGTYIKTETDVVEEYPTFPMDINGGIGSLNLTFARSRRSFYTSQDLILGNEIKITEKTGGVLVYDGYLNKVATGIDDNGNEILKCEFLGYVTEFSQRLFEDADGDTALQALNSDPSAVLTDIIDLFNGKISYGAGTIQNTGISADIVFNGNTIAQAISYLMERVPNNWYWYVGSDNKIYFKPVATVPDHIYIIGKEVKYIDVSERLDNIINETRIIGGTPEGQEQLYRKFSDFGSIQGWGKRQKIVNDGRLFDADSMQYVANSNLSASPAVELAFDLLDNEYDSVHGINIESLKVGDVIKIKDTDGDNADTLWDVNNWDDSYWDTHPNNTLNENLIVTRLDYQGWKLRVTVSQQMPSISKDLETVKRNFEAFVNLRSPINITV